MKKIPKSNFDKVCYSNYGESTTLEGELMNISLTPVLEALVQEKVASGFYNNASEVVRDALRLMHERDQLDAARLQRLRKEATLGFEALDRGERSSKTLDQIFDEAVLRPGRK